MIGDHLSRQRAMLQLYPPRCLLRPFPRAPTCEPSEIRKLHLEKLPEAAWRRGDDGGILRVTEEKRHMHSSLETKRPTRFWDKVERAINATSKADVTRSGVEGDSPNPCGNFCRRNPKHSAYRTGPIYGSLGARGEPVA